MSNYILLHFKSVFVITLLHMSRAVSYYRRNLILKFILAEKKYMMYFYQEKEFALVVIISCIFTLFMMMMHAHYIVIHVRKYIIRLHVYTDPTRSVGSRLKRHTGG